jgi:hypothetical protein
VHAESVRCPHCKKVVKVPAAGDAGRETAGGRVAAEKANRDRVPLTVRHHGDPLPRGVRSRTVVIVWLSLLGVGFIAAAAGIYFLLMCGTATEKSGKGARKAPATVSKTDTASGPAVAAPTAPAAAVAGKDAAAAPPPAAEEDFTLKVERLLGGFKDETVTYAVGHIKNNTGGVVKVIKVALGIADKEDKNLGEATQTILNLPAGATAPLVAEWVHAEGVIGRRWYPGYSVNPAGVPQDLPPVTCEDAVAIRDPNISSTTGKIKVRVTNQGATPLPQVQFYAILTSPEGKMVGVVNAIVDVQLPPKKPVDVTFPWTNCAGHLVQSVEVWAQAGL